MLYKWIYKSIKLLDITKIFTHIDDHTLVQQAMFLCSHDKVVCVVLVIDNVFQINACTKDKWGPLAWLCECFDAGVVYDELSSIINFDESIFKMASASEEDYNAVLLTSRSGTITHWC